MTNTQPVTVRPVRPGSATDAYFVAGEKVATVGAVENMWMVQTLAADDFYTTREAAEQAAMAIAVAAAR